MIREYEVQGIGITELAEQFGTPLYVYDGDVLSERLTTLAAALHERLGVVYSLKANPNVAVCATLHRAGAGAEVSSLAELLTARRAGVDPRDIVFLGPGKSAEEIEACLDHGIYAIICESPAELELIDALAGRRGTRAPVALRVNPSFQTKGSGLTMGGKARQFGIDEQHLLDDPGLAARFPHVRLMGVQCYLGTRILSEESIARNTEQILSMAVHLAGVLGFELEMVDVGGGLGVAYFDNERDLSVPDLAALLNPVLAAFADAHPRTRMLMELGRYLTATAGVYVTRVRYTKQSYGENFAIADGGTNHHMAAVGIGSFVKRNFPIVALTAMDRPATEAWNITGPLCTPNDTVGKKVNLPPLKAGDLIGVLRSGAYGPTASPVLFLSHGYPAEVLVLDGVAHLVSRRDQPTDLLARQQLPAPAAVAVAGT
ncbi:type III PLP-dependent enzyme [Micromonospora sp. NPDC049044]|uniref:type III PLP-dependent enzyme n=1 Tax=unclassified Micromonospora TaxID=2617518 RepID=UPI0033FD9DA0